MGYRNNSWNRAMQGLDMSKNVMGDRNAKYFIKNGDFFLYTDDLGGVELGPKKKKK